MAYAIIGFAVALLLLLDALALIVVTAVFDLDGRGVNVAGVALVVATAAATSVLIPEMVSIAASLRR